MRKYMLVMLNVLAMTTSMFFHEPSSFKLIINAEDADKNTYFGYSLSYQKSQNNLVVGAPNDRTGKVFSCPLKYDATKDNILEPCTRFDAIKSYVESLSGIQRYNDTYKFMLGASVAALPNSFVTCAPMWSGHFKININPTSSYDPLFVWGDCFEVKNESEINVFSGLYGHPRHRLSMRGSFGWRTLVDDVNNLVLISKPSSPPFSGDIVYIEQNNPLNTTTTLVYGINGIKHINLLKSYRNLGTGLAFGNFFDTGSTFKTIYAIGLTDQAANGQVIFLIRNIKRALEIIMEDKSTILQLEKEEEENNSMFGASMCGAKLGGEYEDLIVGAPAQTGYDKIEFGAIHIYTGVKSKEEFIKRELTILGKEEESRFGTTISAHDLDNDGLQEIFISAPYEEDNNGVLYILSGYEIKQKLAEAIPNIKVLDLQSKQIVKKKTFNLLGFSVTPVSDLDDNGCDELAVGAPKSDKIIILRCIPTVIIIVTAELLGQEIVPETINDFQINVCTNLKFNSKMDNIAAKLQMENDIAGTSAVTIQTDRIFTFDLRNKTETYCGIVNITIADNRQGHYKFKVEAQLLTDGLNQSKFDRSWVRISPYSKMSKTLQIQRACSGEECFFKFTMNFKWSGGDINGDIISYAVGSKDEILTLQVSNYGRPAYSACVFITVDHAPGASTVPYQFRLPAGFTNKTKDIQIKLKTSTMTDDFRRSNISAVLYEDCEERKFNQDKNIIIDFEFNAQEILINGSSLTYNITEKSMKTNSETIDFIHEYTIENKGSVLRKNVIMDISHEGKGFIKELKVNFNKCIRVEDKLNCTLDLKGKNDPSSKVKVIVIAVLLKEEIEKSLLNNELKIVTKIALILKHTSEIKYARVETIPFYEKDSSIGQNMLIIVLAVVLAIIVIAVFMYILYKVGFFRRKQKEELEKKMKSNRNRRSKTRLQLPEQECFAEVNEEEVEDEDIPIHCDDIPENLNSDLINKDMNKPSAVSADGKNDQQP